MHTTSANENTHVIRIGRINAIAVGAARKAARARRTLQAVARRAIDGVALRVDGARVLGVRLNANALAEWVAEALLGVALGHALLIGAAVCGRLILDRAIT